MAGEASETKGTYLRKHFSLSLRLLPLTDLRHGVADDIVAVDADDEVSNLESANVRGGARMCRVDVWGADGLCYRHNAITRASSTWDNVLDENLSIGSTILREVRGGECQPVEGSVGSRD